MRVKVLFSILCLVGLGSTLWADEVYLKNGDHLTGKIVSLTEGKLVLNTALSGQVTIDMKNIKTFSSEEPLEVHLKDGTVLHQPLAAAEPNEFALKGGAPLQPQKVPLADVTAINPPKTKWTGNLSAALTLTNGNTKSSSITGSMSLGRRTKQDRTTIDGDIAKGHQTNRDTGVGVTTEDWWRLRGEYDYFFSKKLFGFGNGRYEKDAIAHLDRRVVVGAGGGYQWIENPQTAFSTNLGVASVSERYVNPSQSSNQLSLQAGYAFSQQLGKNVRFLHDLTVFPSFASISDYFLTSTTEVRASLTKNTFANFKIIFNHDATPAQNRGNNDVKYILGVGLNF